MPLTKQPVLPVASAWVEHMSQSVAFKFSKWLHARQSHTCGHSV
jgi:hypothetical protein